MYLSTASKVLHLQKHLTAAVSDGSRANKSFLDLAWQSQLSCPCSIFVLLGTLQKCLESAKPTEADPPGEPQ